MPYYMLVYIVRRGARAAIRRARQRRGAQRRTASGCRGAMPTITIVEVVVIIHRAHAVNKKTPSGRSTTPHSWEPYDESRLVNKSSRNTGNANK